MISFVFLVSFIFFSVPLIKGLDSFDDQQMHLEGIVEEEDDGNGYKDDAYSDEIGDINCL